MPTTPLRVLRSAERPHTETDWIDARHCFSFNSFYDPDNTHFGVLLAANEERLAPLTGYDTHPHRDTEIITWVLEGALLHHDSQCNTGIIPPGMVQRLSAGDGVLHSEKNDAYGSATAQPCRFIQMWVQPDQPGGAVSYAQREVAGELSAGGLYPLASGDRQLGAAITLGQTAATLWAASWPIPQPAPGLATPHPPAPAVQLPPARFRHLQVTRGAVLLETESGPLTLRAGDSVRLGPGGGERLWPEWGTAPQVSPASLGPAARTPAVAVAALPTEILLWTMAHGLQAPS